MRPGEINRRLKEYDPELRLIQNRYPPYDRYRVERHVQGQIIISQKPGDVSWEDWYEVQKPDDRESALEHYILIFDCGANQLDSRIFYTIVMSDLAGVDPGKDIAGRVESMNRKKEKARAAFSDMVGYEAREAWRYANTVRTVSENRVHTAPEGGMSICG